MTPRRSKILWGLAATAAFAATLAGTMIALGGLGSDPAPTAPLRIDKPAPAAAMNFQQQARAEAEANEQKGMAELEAAAGVPLTSADLKRLDSELTRTAQEDAALLALQQLAQNPGDPVELSARRIEDMDRKLAEFKKSVEARQRSRTAPKGPVGYLSLSTANPASAMVFLEADPLGATPITKIPVAVGKHSFRLVGADGESRRLEASIEAGATRDLGSVDVLKLPKWDP